MSLITWLAPESAFKRELFRKKLSYLQGRSNKSNDSGGWTHIGGNSSFRELTLREKARKLVRTNPYAKQALRALHSYVIGPGIKPHATGKNQKAVEKVLKLWADTTNCDFTSQNNLYGLQTLAFKHMFVDGEVLIQRVFDSDSASIPLKLKVIPIDHLDTSKTTIKKGRGHQLTEGIEYDRAGKRVAYWVFEDLDDRSSKRIKASEIIRLFCKDNASQERGRSWLEPVLSNIKDFVDYEDAELLRKKLSACFVGFYRDLEATGEDALEDIARELTPGSILSAPSGQTIDFSSPPSSEGFASYAEQTKHTGALGHPRHRLS